MYFSQVKVFGRGRVIEHLQVVWELSQKAFAQLPVKNVSFSKPRQVMFISACKIWHRESNSMNEIRPGKGK